MWPECSGRTGERTSDLQVNRRSHIGVVVAMIGKGASFGKRVTKGATNGYGPAIKARPVITGDRMRCWGHILPDDGRANSDRQRRGAEAKAPIALGDDQHNLRGAWYRRRRWLIDRGSRRRCLNNGCRCWDSICAGSVASPAGGKQ